MADYRSDLAALAQLPVATEDGARQVRLGQLASVQPRAGASMLRNEDGLLTGYVYIDLAHRDASSYVAEARQLLAANITLPPGYALTWSGQYEAIQRVRERMAVVIPITLAAILMLIYINTASVVKTCIVMLAVPFSAVGAVWLLYLLDYHMSVAVWVGLIALVGVDAETGVFMLLYLDLEYAQAKREGRLTNLAELQQAVMNGAVKRLRPKFMTVAAMFLGLVPILWAAGTGADVMKRIAAPMIGGVFTSFVLELIIYPPVYQMWKWRTEVKRTTNAS